jgi:hypothetical protein
VLVATAYRAATVPQQKIAVSVTRRTAGIIPAVVPPPAAAEARVVGVVTRPLSPIRVVPIAVPLAVAVAAEVAAVRPFNLMDRPRLTLMAIH